jgi:protein-tyrosine-phosphatase
MNPAAADAGGVRRPGSVLFVCAMNAIRSPMAEHLTKKLFGQSIYVQSAGVEEGRADPFTAAALAEHGIDLGDHTPRTLAEIGDTYFDLIVTLSPEAHHRALQLARAAAADVEYWPTFDPSTVAGNREQVLAAYRQVRDALEKRIRARFGSSPC